MTEERVVGPTWHGLPMVMELRAAFERCRVAVSGTVAAVLASADEPGRPIFLGYRCVLDDGTGQIDLVFLGRDNVPGLGVGMRCHVEGTARMDRGRLAVWNPLYRLEPPGGDENRASGGEVSA